MKLIPLLHVRRALATVLAAGTLACTASLARAAGSQLPFPDFGFMAAPGTYSGPVFKLSQNYPKSLPPKSAVPAFFSKLPKTPFSASDFGPWHDYMIAVRDYCFEGNTAVDFRVENNKVRAWYHIPWQHYGPAGREGIHGITKEASVQPKQLAPTQGTPNDYDFYQTYAVGFFNDFAGYTIGQVWADHMKPDPSKTNRADGGGFHNGTVIFKLLFVDVPPAQVPSLVNPMQWQGYIQKGYNNAARSIRTVSLIQMDIAIRDDRAPTGWLFGTFQYNGAVSSGPAWTNLVPLGIMWGNDPTITDDAYTNKQPTVTKINPNLKESAINPNANELPPTHLGWNGRLNGPVDNPVSSCMSCHMTAEIPTLSPLNPSFQANPPPVGSPAWMRWFANIACGEPFDKAAKSTDYGLQLSMGIENFLAWNVPAQSGLFASDYTAPAPAPAAAMLKTSPGAREMTAPAASSAGSAVMPVKGQYPIIRDVPPPSPEK